MEAGEDEDGFPKYRVVTDWFKIDPVTGEPLLVDLYVAGNDDADGNSRRWAGADDGDDEDRYGRRRSQSTPRATRKRQTDRNGYARPDAFGAYGR